jgi:hypothetical protein
MRLFFDENFSENTASAFNYLSKGHFQGIEVVSVIQAGWKGKEDPEFIPLIGKENGVLITRDTDFTPKLQAQFQLCKDHGVGIFFFKPIKGVDTHWGLIKLLSKNWERMIEVCNIRVKPWAYKISPRAFTPL